MVCESVPDQGVGIINRRRFRGGQHAFGQIFQVDLMNNADSGRDDFERVEGLHPPFEELVAFAVALEFHVQVARHRFRAAGEIHLHRVVHHQVHRHERLDDFWIPAQTHHRRAHGRQVHQERHAGEILQDNARHDEWNLLGARRFGPPLRQFADVVFRDLLPVAIAQHRFEDQAHGDGQFGNLPDAGFFQGGERVKCGVLAVAGVELLKRIKNVMCFVHGIPPCLAADARKWLLAGAASSLLRRV